MIEFLTILALMALLIVNYYIFSRDIVAPVSIFLITFILSLIDATLNLNVWNTSISPNTVLVIIFGAVTFSVISIVIHNIFIKSNRNSQNVLNYDKSSLNTVKPSIETNNTLLIIFLIFQLMIIFFVQKYIKILTSPYVGDNSLSSAISMYQYLTKFTTLNLAFPKVLTYAYILSSSGSFIFGYIFIYNFYFFKKINWLVILNLVTSLIGTFFTGSRGVAIQSILSLIIIYLIFYRKNNNAIKMKALIKPSIIILTIMIMFRFLAKLMGRDHSMKIFEYISVYLGAPIKNLDTFLNSGFDVNQYRIWGYNTFSMQWQWLNDRFSLNIPQDTINVEMQYLNNHNLGNVFTAYKDYILDFGYVGSLICISLMALIVGILYEVVTRYDTNKIKHSSIYFMVIYSYLLSSVAFTFFSNKFYESFTITFVQRILCWVILGYIFIKYRDIGKERISDRQKSKN